MLPRLNIMLCQYQWTLQTRNPGDKDCSLKGNASSVCFQGMTCLARERPLGQKEAEKLKAEMLILNFWPWLMWLSGLSTHRPTKGTLAGFPVGPHAWVAGQVPRRGRARGNRSVSLTRPVSLSLSLPSSLSKINKLTNKLLHHIWYVIKCFLVAPNPAWNKALCH